MSRCVGAGLGEKPSRPSRITSCGTDQAHVLLGAHVRSDAGMLGPDTYVDLMAQYFPAGLVGRTDVRDSYPEINRHLHRDEYVRAVELADELGLRRLDRRSVASGYLLAT